MLDRIKRSLLFALVCDIGATLSCLIMGVYRGPIKLLLFFAAEFMFAFAFHILLTLFSEKVKRKKQ